MEAHPPTYALATTTLLHDPLSLIAPYLARPSLLACCLVSSHWSSVFNAYLWGNPSQSFVTRSTVSSPTFSSDENEEEFPPFDPHRFLVCVLNARYDTRALTHTLTLSPTRKTPGIVRTGSITTDNDNVAGPGGGAKGKAIASDKELYTTTFAGVRSSWLRDLVSELPGLQCLDISCCNDVGHDTLMAFGPHKMGRSDGYLMGLKLLDVSGMVYATTKGLVTLFGRCEHVLYLDVTGTEAVRSVDVINAIGKLRALRVLNIRDLGSLNAERSEAVVKALGRRVRWVDLRGTQLDEDAVESLIEDCVNREQEDIGHIGPAAGEPPTYEEGFRKKMAITSAHDKGAEAFADIVYQSLISGQTDRLVIEDEPEVGITHLSLDCANLAVETIRSVFLQTGLIYLDLDNWRSMATPFTHVGKSMLKVARRRRTDIRHLRLPYTIFFCIFAGSKDRDTPVAASTDDVGGDSEIPSGPTTASLLEIALSIQFAKLGSLVLTHIPAFANATSPDSTSAQSKVLSIHSSQPSDLLITLIETLAKLRQTSHAEEFLTYSPWPIPEADVIDDQAPSYDDSFSFSTLNPQTERKETASLSTLTAQQHPEKPTTDKEAISSPLSIQTQSLTTNNAAASHSNLDSSASRAGPSSRPHFQKPSKHPMHTLTLEIIQTTFHPSSTDVIPQPTRTNTASSSSIKSPTSSRGWNYHHLTKSVTGDSDSEALWTHANAQGGDFSFFDEDGEADLYAGDVETKHKHEDTHERESEKEVTAPPVKNMLLDVVAEVAKFRREARERYEFEREDGGGGGIRPGPGPGTAAAKRRKRGRRRESHFRNEDEEEEVKVEGYWDGAVRVVRNR